MKNTEELFETPPSEAMAHARATKNQFIETRLEICLIFGTIAGIGGIVALKFLR